MSGLLGMIIGRPKSTQIAGFQVQTSVYGRPIPIVYGLTRIAGNLVHMPKQPLLKSSGQSKATRSTKGAAGGEMYIAPMVISLCEGPIAGIGYAWRDKDARLAFVGNYDVNGWLVKTGTISQAAWSYLTTNFPGEAVPYQFTAYVANSDTPLPSDSMSQYSWEIQGFLPFQGFSLGQISDALPPDILNDLLTNANYGVGWSSAQIASLTTMQDYCAAAGLFCSLAVDESKPGADWINEVCEVANTALVWSDGKLKTIPYGDVALTGNGHTYTPNTTPLYDLTDSNYLPRGGDLDPIQVTRTDPATAFNQVTVEFRDRNHDYNITTYTAQDQYAIQQYGVIPLTLTLHSITQASIAQQVAQMRLQREQNVRNRYAFRLGWRYSLLEPMDLVTLSDVGLGLSLLPVRLVSVSEGSDEAGFDVVAEEWPFGTASATLYSTPNPTGTLPNANVDPGNTATPIITEAPAALKTSPLDLFIAARGGVNWGGCDVYISTDNVAFSKVGRIVGAAAMGATTALVNSGVQYPTVDSTNTVPVDITASGRTLASSTATDFANLVPTCYLGGEWIAFQTATLTSLGHYNLTTLYRGLYGSTVGSHGNGSLFFLLDSAVARIPWPQGKAGEVLWFKFPAFNIYGAQLQDVASVSSVSYTLGNDPTQFANAAPQGTVSIAANGVWSASWDGPSNAVSYRYIAQTSGFASDASVIASGTIVNGRSQTITSGGTLSFGQTIFISIVPFTGPNASSTQLPSIHIRGSYQTFSATKTVNYSAAGWNAQDSFVDPGTGNNVEWAVSDNVTLTKQGVAALERWFVLFFQQAPGCTLVSVAVDVSASTSGGAFINGVGVELWHRVNFGSGSFGYTRIGNANGNGLGFNSLTMVVNDATANTSYYVRAFVDQDSAGGAPVTQLGSMQVVWTQPDPTKSL